MAVSIAAARGFAHAAGLPLHAGIAERSDGVERIPVPHFNVLNGGAHAADPLDFQEFMIAPVGAAGVTEAVEVGAAVCHALAARIRHGSGTGGLGDEGGFAPDIAEPRGALDLLVSAIADTRADPSLDGVAVVIDPAANGFSLGNVRYRIAEQDVDRDELVDLYARLLDAYPIRLIGDGFAEDDRQGWLMLFDALAGRTELVGDDLYVTDPDRIAAGVRDGLSDATMIKPNQIGTVSDTLRAIEAARDHDMHTFIADLAVGTGVGQPESGAPARGERAAKYNRLLQISENGPGIPYGTEPE